MQSSNTFAEQLFIKQNKGFFVFTIVQLHCISITGCTNGYFFLKNNSDGAENIFIGHMGIFSYA